MNWSCPKCDAWMTGPHNRLHRCDAMGGLAIYFVPVGTNVKIETVEREDYVGEETVRLTEGRPIMSVVTTRDEGQDCIVYAPVAKADGKGN